MTEGQPANEDNEIVIRNKTALRNTAPWAKAGAAGVILFPSLEVLLVPSVEFSLTLIPCFIAGGIWINKACHRARDLSADMKTTPGWAVGWYFVPIASLWKPYLAMREIWHVSKGLTTAKDRKGEDGGLLLRWWWASFIISTITNNVMFKNPEIIPAELIIPFVMIEIANAGLFYYVVKDTTEGLLRSASSAIHFH